MTLTPRQRHAPESIGITNQKAMTRAKARLAQAGVQVTSQKVNLDRPGWSLTVEMSLDSDESVSNYLTVRRNVTI